MMVMIDCKQQGIILQDLFTNSINKLDFLFYRNINDINMVLTVLVTVPISIFLFVAIHFKKHLFVWTVFSPKLVYEFFHLCLMFVIVLCTFVINKLV